MDSVFQGVLGARPGNPTFADLIGVILGARKTVDTSQPSTVNTVTTVNSNGQTTVSSPPVDPLQTVIMAFQQAYPFVPSTTGK